jgi:predicted aldo/keto reductase-like oxidoreductase
MGSAGQSEPFVGKVLRDGYREKVKIATKLPSWLIKTRSDMDKYLDEQLKRLVTDSIDFYLVHALNDFLWKRSKKRVLLTF